MSETSEQKQQKQPTREELLAWIRRETERCELHLSREFGAVAALIEIDIKMLTALRALVERDAEREKYLDLLYEVQRKCTGETRHETAKRLLREAENGYVLSATAEKEADRG